MKVFITGVCGFVGSALAEGLLEKHENLSICGVDNLMRPGSEINRTRLRQLGVTFVHGDVRAASDFENLPAADWVIDAAANPSVLAGVQAGSGSRQLFEHNSAEGGSENLPTGRFQTVAVRCNAPRNRDRVFYEPANLALWQYETRFGNHRARIRKRFRFPGLD